MDAGLLSSLQNQTGKRKSTYLGWLPRWLPPAGVQDQLSSFGGDEVEELYRPCRINIRMSGRPCHRDWAFGSLWISKSRLMCLKSLKAKGLQSSSIFHWRLSCKFSPLHSYLNIFSTWRQVQCRRFPPGTTGMCNMSSSSSSDNLVTLKHLTCINKMLQWPLCVFGLVIGLPVVCCSVPVTRQIGFLFYHWNIYRYNKIQSQRLTDYGSKL